ncbi:diguanylate cyclase [Vibrio maritimus]|uniref:Diguanylate cyclase n=1 Tax=Vibrio maritimus TaxID=990268 RepID=A0A090RS80_9VIBR|nr:diguanylate cyclase [Vibrio maritimus]
MIRESANHAERHTIKRLVTANISPIIVSDLQGKLLYVDNSYATVLGYSQNEIFSSNVVITHPDSLGLNKLARVALVDQVIDEISIDKTYLKKNGDILNAELKMKLYFDKVNLQKVLVSRVNYASDKRSLNDLYTLAYCDALTGLYNRNYLSIVEHIFSPSFYSYMLYFDINEFKQLNDEFGHQFGDQVLIHFARHLRSATNDLGTNIRLGGDEFITLLSGVRDQKLLTEMVRNLESFKVVTPNSCSTKVSVSVGVVPINEQSISLSKTIAIADTAMYCKKRYLRRQG